MNQLTRHIEILLLNNDCVIVPDFGGFVAHWVPARYEQADRTFLPPTRTLGFNSQLRMNDSLLAQSYVEAYDISYPEALRAIEQDVEQIRQQLENEGSYTLNGLGTLTVNMEGNYEFEPFMAGLLSPEIYGLSGVSIKRLRDEAIATETAAIMPMEASEEETSAPALLDFTTDGEDESKAISIKMSWIRNAVAVAAAIVAFFMFATPVVNSDLGSQSMSQLQGNILYKMMPKDTNVTPAQPVVAKETKAVEPAGTELQAVAEKQETAKTQTAAQPAASDTYYYIVLASQVKRSNADAFVEKLHKQGYAEAEVLVYHDVVRVVCGMFKSESEAYRRLNKLNTKEEFAEAWVFKKKSV